MEWFESMIFRALYDQASSTYTYLLGSLRTGTVVLFDTVLEQHDRDCRVLEKLGLRLEAVIDTHIHADHITGAWAHKRNSGCQIIMPGDPSLVNADRLLVAKIEKIELAGLEVIGLATPGHTAHHYAYEIPGIGLLTGDALLIDGCGRTDFQQGDAGALYESIHEIVLNRASSTLLYPAHNYKGEMVTTVGEEKGFNPRVVGVDRASFIKMMANLNLPHPKQIDRAVPANLRCGDV